MDANPAKHAAVDGGDDRPIRKNRGKKKPILVSVYFPSDDTYFINEIEKTLPDTDNRVVGKKNVSSVWEDNEIYNADVVAISDDRNELITAEVEHKNLRKKQAAPPENNADSAPAEKEVGQPRSGHGTQRGRGRPRGRGRGGSQGNRSSDTPMDPNDIAGLMMQGIGKQHDAGRRTEDAAAAGSSSAQNYAPRDNPIPQEPVVSSILASQLGTGCEQEEIPAKDPKDDPEMVELSPGSLVFANRVQLYQILKEAQFLKKEQAKNASIATAVNGEMPPTAEAVPSSLGENETGSPSAQPLSNSAEKKRQKKKWKKEANPADYAIRNIITLYYGSRTASLEVDDLTERPPVKRVLNAILAVVKAKVGHPDARKVESILTAARRDCRHNLSRKFKVGAFAHMNKRFYEEEEVPAATGQVPHEPVVPYKQPVVQPPMSEPAATTHQTEQLAATLGHTETEPASPAQRTESPVTHGQLSSLIPVRVEHVKPTQSPVEQEQDRSTPDDNEVLAQPLSPDVASPTPVPVHLEPSAPHGPSVLSSTPPCKLPIAPEPLGWPEALPGIVPTTGNLSPKPVTPAMTSNINHGSGSGNTLNGNNTDQETANIIPMSYGSPFYGYYSAQHYTPMHYNNTTQHMHPQAMYPYQIPSSLPPNSFRPAFPNQYSTPFSISNHSAFHTNVTPQPAGAVPSNPTNQETLPVPKPAGKENEYSLGSDFDSIFNELM